MKIAMSKTREAYPLSPKKIIKKTIGGSITLAIILIVLFVFSVIVVLGSPLSEFGVGLFGIVALIILVIFFVTILINYLYQRWYFEVYFYDLANDYIQIKKGPITPREITIPYERIQDIYVDQDLLDRLFGLYDVHLSSATVSSGMEAHIDGVEKKAADGLRTILLKTVQQRISKNRPANTNNPAI